MKLARLLGLFFAAAILLGGVEAYARETPLSQPQILYSYAAVVKKASPAVVNIYTKKVVNQRVVSPFMNDPFFQRFFGGPLPDGFSRKRLENSLGSGVIVKPDGLIVTSNHVINGADEITVVLSDRREFEATLVVADERSDLAVLKINPKNEALPFLELTNSDEAEVGDLVLAVGNPFGVGQTVTSGIISALARTNVDINDLNYFIQTDAAINPGNSGGALVTMDGRLIGINAAIYSRDGGNMGIGFAVPSNMVRVVMDGASGDHKGVVRPWMGINGQPVTSDIAQSLNMDRPIGLLVKSVHAASPAAAAGLKVGDVILSVNGKETDDMSSFTYRITTQAVGDTVELGVLRKGQKISLSFKLIAAPESVSRDETLIKGRSPLAGARLANLSPAVAERYGLKDSDSGVVVVDVVADAPAANLGISKGDIILKINGTDIKVVKDAASILEKNGRGWRLTILRGGNLINMMIGG